MKSKNRTLKIAVFCAAALALSAPEWAFARHQSGGNRKIAQADSADGASGDSSGDSSGGHHGWRGKRGPGSKAFQECVAASGVAMPEHPKPSDAEIQARKSCRTSTPRTGDRNTDRAAMQTCMTNAGFTPPARPALTDDQKQVFQRCRSSAAASSVSGQAGSLSASNSGSAVVQTSGSGGSGSVVASSAKVSRAR